jgi:flagellar biosynthesis protein FlhF
MIVKKFEAPTMKEALDKIKEELGPDAFILATKNIAKKGPLGFGERSFLQVTAAVEEEPNSGASTTLEEDSEATPFPPSARSEFSDFSKTYGRSATAGRKPSATPPLSRARVKGQSGTPLAGSKAQPMPAKGPVEEDESFQVGFQTVFKDALAEGEKDPPRKELRRELHELRRMVEDMNAKQQSSLIEEMAELKGLLYKMSKQATAGILKSSLPSLISLYHELRQLEFDEVLAAKLLDMAEKRLSRNDLNQQKVVRGYVQTLISRSLSVSGPLKFSEGIPTVLAFVGPTGVGKTTTLAKLAAYSALHLNEPTALISLDTYRIAAVDQLKTYAKIMDIPIQVALNVNELKKAVQFHQDKSLILIDTAGRSPFNKEGISELQGFFKGQPEIQRHLVLGANTKPSDMEDIVREFSPLEPQFLLFTKLDETRRFGGLFTQMIRTKMPVSFLTTGQSVPEDFAFATPEMLAGLLLGGRALPAPGWMSAHE